MAKEKTQQQTDKDKYGLTLAGLYETKNGYQTAVFKDPYLESLIASLNSIGSGGRLVISRVSDAAKEKNEKLPDAFLTYLNPDQVQKRKEMAKTKNDDIDI